MPATRSPLLGDLEAAGGLAQRTGPRGRDGYERVRFPAPPCRRARVRATAEVIGVEPRHDGWWQVVQRFTVELESAEKPACVAHSVVWVRPVTPRQ